MIDRDFEQMSEEHMKSMTKPEGPAQEPQVTFEKIDVCPFCFARYTIGPVSGRCYKCDQFIEPVPATPAPSQPAGAREPTLQFVLDYFATHGGWPHSCADLVELLKAHTAAKDALIDDLRRQRDLEWDSRKAAQSGRIAAERERDSLRAERDGMVRELGRNSANVADGMEVARLVMLEVTESRRKLKAAGKDGQQ